MSGRTQKQHGPRHVSEMFVMRVPMLKSCPCFLRGRLRFSFFVTLWERPRCKLEQDMQGEMVPMLFLHRPKHVGSVGRDELAKRPTVSSKGSGQV